MVVYTLTWIDYKININNVENIDQIEHTSGFPKEIAVSYYNIWNKSCSVTFLDFNIATTNYSIRVGFAYHYLHTHPGVNPLGDVCPIGQGISLPRININKKRTTLASYYR